MEIGQRLLSAKAHLDHGFFGSWCHQELGYEPRRSQNYMNAARLFEEHGEIVFLLPLSAAQMLGAAGVHPHVVEDVLERVRRGGLVTVKWVEERVRGSNRGTRRNRTFSNESRIMAAIIAEALHPDICELLHAFVLERPAPR